MAFGVTDCSSSIDDFNIEKATLNFPSQESEGLGKTHEVTHIHPTAPKPNFIQRIAIAVTLIFFHMVTWTVQFTNWILKSVFGYESRQKVLYRELHHISKKGDVGKIEEFLVEHSENSFAASYLFSEFIDLPHLYAHLPQILEGANVCLVNDGGFFCRRWSEHPDSYPRISSHQYQGNECYAIGHFLFWLDLDGNTRFQFENSPLRGFFSTINHIVDYLRYKRDNEQQGVTGTSPYTEQYCLKVEVDPADFIARKLG